MRYNKANMRHIKGAKIDMYHISLYFDEKSNNIINQHIKQIALKTGNDYMLSASVPPHITVAAFNTATPNDVVRILGEKLSKITRGEIKWVGVGTFLPNVIYITPVLNEYIDRISKISYNTLSEISYGNKTIQNEMTKIEISSMYKPFSWIPHTTIGKKLSGEEMKLAFEVMQSRFGVFSGEVVSIGIAKTNPYENIAIYDLKQD